MKANLSLVLDERLEVRLDLMKDVELIEIDKYTTTKKDSKEIREEYKEQIDSFLEMNKKYTDTFKKESNKKGSIVIVFKDEVNTSRRLRVLYKHQINKLDMKKVINGVCSAIKKFDNLYITHRIMDNFKYSIFRSNFERKVIDNVRDTVTNPFAKDDKKALTNKKTIKLMKDKFLGLCQSNNENQVNACYYYLRILDSYVEKEYKVNTTSTTIKSKIGKVEVSSLNDINDKQVINKENKYNDMVLKEEDDGQLSFTDLIEDIKDNDNNNERVRMADLAIEMEESYNRK